MRPVVTPSRLTQLQHFGSFRYRKLAVNQRLFERFANQWRKIRHFDNKTSMVTTWWYSDTKGRTSFDLGCLFAMIAKLSRTGFVGSRCLCAVAAVIVTMTPNWTAKVWVWLPWLHKACQDNRFLPWCWNPYCPNYIPTVCGCEIYRIASLTQLNLRYWLLWISICHETRQTCSFAGCVLQLLVSTKWQHIQRVTKATSDEDFQERKRLNGQDSD